MINPGDSHSLSDFQRNTREHIDRMRQTGRPEILTVNGQAEIVVQDAEAYQRLLDALERAEAIAGIQRGLASMERGEGKLAREALQSIRETREEQRPNE